MLADHSGMGHAFSGAPDEHFWTRTTVLATVAAVALLLAAMLFSAAVMGGVTCSGDGGSPYAAPDSPRGRFCEAGGASIPLWGPLIALLVGGGLALSRGRRSLLTAAFVAAFALALSPYFLANALSKDCADFPHSATSDELLRYLEKKPDCGHY